MEPTGNYNVISVNPAARIFVIQMQAEADNCDGSKILQLSQSSPFNLTSKCHSDLGNFTSDSSLNGTVELEISWKSPLEPTCTSSADCKDWPNSSCNETGNGQKRCLCDTTFHWDGSALNCSRG